MNDGHLRKVHSIEELAQFWDTQDLTDFEEKLEEVPDRVFNPDADE